MSGSIVTDIACNGDTNGAIDYAVGGFGSTYSYTVNGVLPATTGQNSATLSLTGLSTGSYTVEVTDEVTNCTASALVTLNNPTAISSSAVVVNANCNVSTAEVTFTTSGGTPGYEYAAGAVGFSPVYPGDSFSLLFFIKSILS